MENFDDAGKAFKGIALLYDDPAITSRALDKAAVAFAGPATPKKTAASHASCASDTTRSQHTATLLPNGVVLVAGGLDSSFTALRSAELFRRR